MEWCRMEVCRCSTTLPSKPAVPSCSFHPPRLSSLSPFPSNALSTPPPLKPPASVFTGRRGGKWSPSPAPGLLQQRPEAMQVPGRYRRRQGIVVAPASATAPSVTTTAATAVRDFYDGINRRDLASVALLISEACVYEDLIFSAPFVGRKAIMDFFEKFTESISSDLQFVIDDMSTEDSSAVGVSWHLGNRNIHLTEWRGRPFPFSKGCSFYRLEVLDGKRQIVYGRDCVEPAIKPGDMALVLIRGVTSVLKQFPQLADLF